MIELEKIKFIESDKRNFSMGRTAKIEYIVIHYTAGNGDTAENNAIYFRRGSRNASAHYFVDSKQIVQSVLTEDTAWHCGATTYKHNKCRNTNSIGVEICSKKNGVGAYYFDEEAVNNAVNLVKALMKKYNIPIGNVLRHYDVTGKICPAPFVHYSKQWDDFKTACGGKSKQKIDMQANIEKVQNRLEKPFEEKTIAYINNYKYASEIWDRLAKMR